MGRKRKKHKIETFKTLKENNQIPYLSAYIADKIKNLFEINKIPQNKILTPTIIYNPKKGIRIKLWENEFSNFHHFINWTKIHWFFILPKELILKINGKQFKISSIEDIDSIKNLEEDTKNYFKTFINALSFGALANIKNWNIFLGNIYLKNCVKLFEYRNIFEEILFEIKWIYKRNYVKKAISEIIFAEILLNFIQWNKKLDHIDYSILSIDLATFNDDHNKKIDHILKIINPLGIYEYDIQLTIWKFDKKKKETFKKKFEKELENPFVLLSLRYLFPDGEKKEENLRKEYMNYIENKLREKKTIWWNFFPYFFRNLPEWLVKWLKEITTALLIFFVKLSNNNISLKENTRIPIWKWKNSIIVRKAPEEFKNNKNNAFFIDIVHNNEPLAEMRLILPKRK